MQNGSIIKNKKKAVQARPAMLYGLETMALGRRRGGEVVEIKMLRFSLGGMGMDKIRNKYIRGIIQVRCFWR